jgi:signal transduction histidine kinase
VPANRGPSASLERLTYALVSSESPTEAAANATRLIRRALGSDGSVRIAVAGASGRLRIGWRSSPTGVDGPRLRTARRAAFDRKAYRSVPVTDDGGTVAHFFPLMWRDRPLGVLEVQTPVHPSVAQRAMLGSIACQLAGVMAGLAERRQLEQQVVTFEARADTARDMVQALRPQAALDIAANTLWRSARHPVAIWWADQDVPRSLVSVVGVASTRRQQLVDALRAVTPGEVVTTTERSSVIEHVVRSLGRSTRITSSFGDRCVVVVAASGPLLSRRIELMTDLVDDILPIVASSARYRLEASNLDVGLAWTAHELRTPILGVKAAIESVVSRTDPSAEELLRLSVEELGKLASDAEGILGWAAGRRGLDLQPIDVSALVAETVRNDMQHLGTGTKITVDAPQVTVGLVDHAQLRVAVSNLVRNALAYGAMEAVRVTVRETVGAVRVSVADDGPGVPDEERDLIFEPFARGGAGAGLSGSGLGLFITRQVAEAHGGRTWVDTDGRGRGATFHIEVPTDGGVLQRPAS